MADLLENLNEKQREAVLETEGYVRVIAGAGSGKTKLLVSRYAYLVQDYGIDAGNILCVTFTNKAAGEMKKRIRALIGDENDISLICTYHGFCNRLLRENPEKLFLNKQFQIIDNYQQKAILSEIYQKYELKLDYASFESILRKIGYVKRDTQYVPRMCNPRPCQIMAEMKNQDDRIIEEFLQRQKAAYFLDFHDLISFAIYLLETDSEVRGKWQDRLNYIMVDEFQDSSSVEMRLVEILSGKFRNLMIVGDPDQNIYEWRGSDVKLLVDFDKEHEPTKTIILNQNYRSTPQILRCANTLIEKNVLRLEKDLFTKNAAGAPVVHYHSKNDLEEMDHVIDNIKTLCAKEGFKYSDFAIIYRSGFLSRVAEKKLVEKNIPYEIFGGVRFYQRMEILDILAYLKLIAFDDDASFRRIVNTPRRRFGRAKMNLLEALRDSGPEYPAPENNRTLYAVLSGHLDIQDFSNSDIGSFVHLIEAMRSSYKTKRISEIVNEVTKDSGYESYIRELGDEERLDNLAEFKRIANEFEREFGENLSLEEFLQQIALQSGENGDESKDAVKLMTIHSSKGLEFPVVFILGFTEGVFPSSKTLGDRKNLGLEEERRLCYVAITRAEKYLFLMESEGVSENGIKKLVSRFIEEIGEGNYVRIGRISDELLQESRGYTAKLNREIQSAPTDGREIGDVVEHHIFGKGTIEAIDKKRGSYSIKFEKLQQIRNISSSYFMKKHEDARLKTYDVQEGSAGKDDRGKDSVQKDSAGKDDGRKNSVQEDSTGKDDGRKDSEQEDSAGKDDGRKDSVQKGDGQEDNVGKENAAAAQHVSKEALLQGLDSPIDMVGAWQAEGIITLPAAGSGEEEGLEGLPQEEILEEKFLEAESIREFMAAEGITEEFREAGDIQEEQDFCVGSYTSPEKETETAEAEAVRLRERKENSPNLWKREEVPHSGWNCVGVEDLGAPVGICEMCGYQIIRYAHVMEHPRYQSLSVGCVCAGKMEGDVEEAKRREAEFKNRQARRMSFFKRKWKQSKKGNEYLKIDGHIVVLYHYVKEKQFWKYSIDNEFCKLTYATRERAIAGAFGALEKMKR